MYYHRKSDDCPSPCEQCAKHWDSLSSLCSRCGELVTNGAFFKKTSPHFKGTCRPPKAFPETIPEPRWKSKLPYPMPAAPRYESKIFPTNIEEFRAWWKLPEPSDKTAELIAALEQQNELLRKLA